MGGGGGVDGITVIKAIGPFINDRLYRSISCTETTLSEDMLYSIKETSVEGKDVQCIVADRITKQGSVFCFLFQILSWY